MKVRFFLKSGQNQARKNPDRQTSDRIFYKTPDKVWAADRIEKDRIWTNRHRTGFSEKIWSKRDNDRTRTALSADVFFKRFYFIKWGTSNTKGVINEFELMICSVTVMFVTSLCWVVIRSQLFKISAKIVFQKLIPNYTLRKNNKWTLIRKSSLNNWISSLSQLSSNFLRILKTIKQLFWKFDEIFLSYRGTK